MAEYRAARPAGQALDGPGPPLDLDLSRPSIARLYDYMLGGKDNFEVDRRAGDALCAAVPETRQLAEDNRNHLRRAVQWLVRDAGIRQLVDLGSGLPTRGNVHDLAHAVDPGVRVVYVDNDPLVLAHGRALLADNNNTTVVMADVRCPAAIFDDPRTRKLIDVERPFAVIASSVLHHFDDDEAYEVAWRIRELLRPGCYALISNFLDDDEQRAHALECAFLDADLGTARFRTWEEQRRFYEGLETVEPGLVYANDWRPDELTPENSPVHTLYAAAVARRP